MNLLFRPLSLSLFYAAIIFAAPATSAQPQDLLSRVQQKGTFTVGTEARRPPYEYVENGKIVGYTADLLQYVMEGIPGVKVNQLDLPWQSLLPGLDAKRLDMVVTVVTVNKERARHFAFTAPVADATVGILLRKGSSISKPEDLAGKVVGSQTGSAQLSALQMFDAQLKASGSSGIKQIRQYVGFDEAYADLANGRLDAVAESKSNFGRLMKARAGVYSVLDADIGAKSYFSWVARKDEDSARMLQLVSDRIVKANQDGTMAKLQRKWFDAEMNVPEVLPEPEQ